MPRKRRKRRAKPKANDTKRMAAEDVRTHESAASKSYRDGKSFRYGNRIAGPIFPVTISHIGESDD